MGHNCLSGDHDHFGGGFRKAWGYFWAKAHAANWSVCVFSGVAPMRGITHPNILIAARAFQGIGAAFIMTLTIALMRELAPKGRVGRSMGLIGSMSAVGTALGPSIGGFLIAASSWRAIFLVLVFTGLLSMGSVLRAIPTHKPRGKPAKTGFAGLGSFGLFPNMFANFVVSAVMMTTLIVGPFYLSLSLGLNEASVGLAMSVGPIISICTGIPSGRLVDAWGTRSVLCIDYWRVRYVYPTRDMGNCGVLRCYWHPDTRVSIVSGRK